MFDQVFDITPMKYTFILYTLVMLLIGFVAYVATKNLSDYILGGRKMGSLVTALSAGASDMSGWLLLGLPGAIFLVGLSKSWIAIGLIIGALLNWSLVAGRLRAHTEVFNDSLTLPAYLNQRFEDHSGLIRLVSSIIILIFFTIYCASGMVAGARLFETTFDLPYAEAIWYGAAATIIYVFIGGYIAVSWTDTVQALLMFFALIAVPTFCFLALNQTELSTSIAASSRLEQLRQMDSSHWDLFHEMDIVAIISLLAWGLGYFGQPHILSRFMAADSVKTMKNARLVGMSWMIICLLGAIAVGFLGFAFFNQAPDSLSGSAVFHNPELVFLEAAKLLFNPWIAGVILSAVLAAVMSTLSCQLLVCSSTVTEDLYKGMLRPNASQNELVWIGRLMVLVIAVVAIFVAHNPDSAILTLVAYAWAGFGAAFGPIILFSLIWRRMTRLAAIMGMAIGALTTLLWQIDFGAGSAATVTGLYEIIPGFCLNVLAIVVISLYDKAPSESIQKRFQIADRMYQEDK